MVRAGMLLAATLLLGLLAVLVLSGTPPSLVVAQSTFSPSGKPGKARVVLLHPPGLLEESWTQESFDDRHSNVFHKAMFFDPVVGEPGILTIGATEARVKLWTRSNSGWDARTLWSGSFGGRNDRLRDAEVADVNGDGVDEIIVATHDQGVLLVLTQEGGDFVAHEIDRTESTYIHEVEACDVDGDGALEIFATPSSPNKLDNRIQPGSITMYRWDGGTYKRTVVESFDTRHVKEVLCSDLEEAGHFKLYAAIEGEPMSWGADTLIRSYRWSKGSVVAEAQDVVSLPGKLCRFLTAGDTDGDGQVELVASTANDGVFSLVRREDVWTKTRIVPGGESRGFEHATVVFDWDEDGRDDIFVAADTLKKVHRFSHDPESGRYVRELVTTFEGNYLIWSILPLPEGF